MEQVIILSTKLLATLGKKAAEKIVWPEFLSAVKNTSLKSPVIPPYTNTAIGVPINGATIDKIIPVTTAVLRANFLFFAMNPTIKPTAKFTNRNGISLGSFKTPRITLVNAPVQAPQKGPKTTAVNTVPTVSINNSGIFNPPTKIPKMILIAIPTAAKTIFFVELFLIFSSFCICLNYITSILRNKYF